MRRLWPVALIALTLAGCNTDSSPAPTAAIAAPGSATPRGPLNGPAGCTRPIADYETIVDRDVTTGYLSQNVYDRINIELGGVRATCAAGREADARAELGRVKTSHGYR